MARDHYDTEWTITDLMASILKEIRVFEPGQRTNPMPTTNSFYMGANGGSTHENRKKKPICVFCKGMHKPNLCTAVSSPKQHLAIVKNAGLCFKCLARHKVSQCPSKFTCRECHKKHHTSLCCAFTSTTEHLPWQSLPVQIKVFPPLFPLLLRQSVLLLRVQKHMPRQPQLHFQQSLQVCVC